ncbi:MAG TPA: DNA polymerase ligase N-terminal domain-containing protein, partial [Phycisphaerae bacterium]|nr:DNA polymerase ligase N-terminal domain-containing protein [Phycisphaerae bacterium]
MSLIKYQQKRNFAKTTEPRGRVEIKSKSLRFVVQKHAASHLHYDFRLEWGGVLKSWAVPKGPSLNPADKRLAMHVEDHPVDYGSFEGTIPKGQYGGGTVMLWDRGTWEPEEDPEAAYRAGKMKFRLNGERLKGRWMLVRMGGARNRDGRSWLLVKERDEAATTKAPKAEEDRSIATHRTMSEIAEGLKTPATRKSKTAAA